MAPPTDRDEIEATLDKVPGEKPRPIATTTVDAAPVSSTPEEEPHTREGLSFAPRSEEPPAYDSSKEQTQIAGYDAALMGARTALSAEEEKKLLRRIDWHLIPLLAIMYMVKTIDAANVSACPQPTCPSQTPDFTTRGLSSTEPSLCLHVHSLGFQRSYHGQGDAEKHYD